MLEKIKKFFEPKSKKNEAHEMYLKLMNTKKAYSCLSEQLVEFTDDIDAHSDETSGAYFNGWLLLDNVAEAEGEDKHIYVVLKDGSKMNLHDFGKEYGIWEEGDIFLENIKNLVADREA